MELFKALKEKKYSELKDYCADRIASIIANKIDTRKNSYLNGLRGIAEDTKVIIKTDSDSDDEDDREVAKKSNKDKSDDDSDDHEEAIDTNDSEGDGEDKKPKKKFPFAKKKSGLDDSESDEK